MIFETIRRVLSEQLEIEPEEIELESDLEVDLNMDSLDGFEMIMALEEEFDLEIGEEAAEKFQTVGDVVDFVSSVIEE